MILFILFDIGVTCTWRFHFPMLLSRLFCLLPWAALLDSWLSYCRVCVAFTSSSVSVLQIHSVCCNGCPCDALGGATASVCILPTRLTASCLRPIWPAVHCVCIEGSRLSAVIGLCRSLWRPLPAAAEGADSSANKSVCLRRGGHPAERAGSGVWVGTPGPVGLSSPRWAPPDTAVGRVSSPRGVAQCLVPRKHP